MSRIKSLNLHSELQRKSGNYAIRITSYLSGNKKNSFLNDCIYRDLNESKVLRQVVDIYYSVLDHAPEIRGKEPEEIKKYLINLIKQNK